jgi:predicted RNase H-like nuclease (RuvC/YqgF family)
LKQKQVKYKVLHQTKAQASKDWEVCERLQGEINILKKEIYSLQQELKCFQRKQQKSKWFKKKKGSCANNKEHQGTSDQPTLRQSIDRLKKKAEAVEEVNQENPIGGDNSEVEECEASNSEVEECDVSTNDKAEECEVSNNEVEECQLDNNEAEENRSSGKDFL